MGVSLESEQDFCEPAGDARKFFATVVGDGEAEYLATQGVLDHLVYPRAFAGDFLEHEFGALFALVKAVVAPEQRCLRFAAEGNPYGSNTRFGIDGDFIDFTKTLDRLVLADERFNGPVAYVAEYGH